MTLSIRQRRGIAVGLLLMALVLLWLGVIAPIATGFTERAALRATMAERALRDAEAIAGLPAARQASRVLVADRGRWLATGGADALQQRFAVALAAAGGDVQRIEVVDDAPAGSMRVRAEARVGLAQLVVLLQRLANDAPLLVIDRLAVAVPTDPPVGDGERQLDVRIEALAASSAPR